MTQIPGMGDVTGPNDGEQVGVGLALLGLPSAQYYATLGICYYRDCVFLRVISERAEKLAARMKIFLLLIFYDSISLSLFFFPLHLYVYMYIYTFLSRSVTSYERINV